MRRMRVHRYHHLEGAASYRTIEPMLTTPAIGRNWPIEEQARVRIEHQAEEGSDTLRKTMIQNFQPNILAGRCVHFTIGFSPSPLRIARPAECHPSSPCSLDRCMPPLCQRTRYHSASRRCTWPQGTVRALICGHQASVSFRYARRSMFRGGRTTRRLYKPQRSTGAEISKAADLTECT
eukprot:1187058-Prorocentrum_minimum.AAC.2